MYNLFIFRRDFRLYDNIGLIYCLNKNIKNVIPIFIFTPDQIEPNKNKYYSHNCVQFMLESLIELNSEINKNDKNKKLYTFYGDNIEILTKICDIIKVNGIIYNKDYTKYSIKRDKKIKNFCIKNNINCTETEDYLLAPIKTFNKGVNIDDYYSVYTPFKNNVINHKNLVTSINSINTNTINKLFINISDNIIKQIKLNFKNNYDYLDKIWIRINKNYNKNIIYKGGRKYGLLTLKKIQ